MMITDISDSGNTMQHKPLVSVVLASYNGEKYIAAQIDSILSQNYVSFEVIVCDDASTDETVRIVATYMQRYPQISLHQNSEQFGFVRNFEKGIGLAKSDYIALSDQDDIWKNDKIMRQMQAMLAEEKRAPGRPVMIHSDLCVIDAEEKMKHDSYFRLKRYRLKKSKDLGHIAGPSGAMGNTILFNRALKEKTVPFPECLAFHDQWIALVNEVSGVRVTLNEPLVRYRIHQNNQSNSEEKVGVDKINVLSSFLRRELTPPYLNSARACMVEEVLTRYVLEKDDEVLLTHFLAYLKGKKGSWELLRALWKYDLLKRDLAYRLAFSLNYLCFKEKQGKLYFFGFSHWKRHFIKVFFVSEGEIVFCQTLDEARAKGMKTDSPVYIWGKKPFVEVEAYVKENKSPFYRVEDGFVRSVSLGSDLTKAYSLVVDSRGIYFDPNSESDLEVMLNEKHFDDALITRARKLQAYLREKRISKYNADREEQVALPGLREGQRVILVPGQVEDDASIQYGADGMSNLELLKRVAEAERDAYIIFKPHPDVQAGNRKGAVKATESEKYCNICIENVTPDSLFDLVDEVHTMTSLLGFEALIRGKKVTTYGLPFYTGWGLTTDKRTLSRRRRKRSLDELVAAALICYPRYINPLDDKPCEVEVFLEALDKEKKRYNENSFYKVYRDGRNALSRVLQRGIKVWKNE